MQSKGITPQFMLEKANSAPFNVKAPRVQQVRSLGTPLDATQSQCLATPWNTEVLDPASEHAVGFTKVLWHAVSISRLADGHRKRTSYLPYDVGDMFDVIANRGLESYTWVAKPYGSALKETGWIISSDFLKVPLMSEHSEYVRSQVFAGFAQPPLTFDAVKVYPHQRLHMDSAWWKVSTLLIIGRFRLLDRSEAVTFCAIGHHGTNRYLPLRMAVYPQTETLRVMQKLTLYAQQILRWIEIMQGRDLRDEWSDLVFWLRGCLLKCIKQPLDGYEN